MFSNCFSENRAVYEMTCRAQNALLHFHCKNGYANASQRHVIRTLPFFFILSPVPSLFRIIFTIMLISYHASGGSNLFRNVATIC